MSSSWKLITSLPFKWHQCAATAAGLFLPDSISMTANARHSLHHQLEVVDDQLEATYDIVAHKFVMSMKCDVSDAKYSPTQESIFIHELKSTVIEFLRKFRPHFDAARLARPCVRLPSPYRGVLRSTRRRSGCWRRSW